MQVMTDLMARFDIYENPGRNKANIPYLVEVQSNVISGLATRIVVPLRHLAGFSKLVLPSDLFPLIAIDGKDYLLDTPQLGAMPSNEPTANWHEDEQSQLMLPKSHNVGSFLQSMLSLNSRKIGPAVEATNNIKQSPRGQSRRRRATQAWGAGGKINGPDGIHHAGRHYVPPAHAGFRPARPCVAGRCQDPTRRYRQ